MHVSTVACSLVVSAIHCSLYKLNKVKSVPDATVLDSFAKISISLFIHPFNAKLTLFFLITKVLVNNNNTFDSFAMPHSSFARFS